MRDRSRSVKLRVLDIGEGGALESTAEPGETEAELWQVAGLNQPGSGTSEAIL